MTPQQAADKAYAHSYANEALRDLQETGSANEVARARIVAGGFCMVVAELDRIAVALEDLVQAGHDPNTARIARAAEEASRVAKAVQASAMGTEANHGS